MGENGKKLLIGKVFLKGDILLKTGLHIGGSKESMQIGGVDLPVIRDSGSSLPYIPGSSLKGKLRSILEKFGKRTTNGKEEILSFNRNIGTRKDNIFIHCCDDSRQAIQCEVCRVFGSSGGDGEERRARGDNLPATLFVRDALLKEDSDSESTVMAEVKIENGIDRISAAANPRRVERVMPGARFEFEMVYDVEVSSFTGKTSLNFQKTLIKKDLENFLTCMVILEAEALGGYGSRGYGKVEFKFSEFVAKSIAYFLGDATKTKGKTDGEFGIPEARTEVEKIINFLEEAANSAIPR